jgi:type II secretory pathway pseudopilin PulG
VLGALWLAQLALLADPTIREALLQDGAEAAAWLLLILGTAVVPGLLLLWRRTRRVGLVLLGTGLIAPLVFWNYWAQVICSIGYVLLLVALWPRWRLAQPAPAGRETIPAIPSRGVLRVHPWPACRRSEADGFTLVTSLVGITCLLITVAIATQMIASTIAAVRRADHAAMAMDVVESARERSLLGRGPGNLKAAAARLLPNGRATVVRTQAEPGVARVTAAVTWRETDGRPGRATLEWLTLEDRP